MYNNNANDSKVLRREYKAQFSGDFSVIKITGYYIHHLLSVCGAHYYVIFLRELGTLLDRLNTRVDSCALVNKHVTA